MANVYSSGVGGAVTGVSIDNNRRVYGFGDRIASLDPIASPFFTYLSRVAKRPTNDPVFKFLERRHQWQRRNFAVQETKTGTSVASAMTISAVKLGVKYDQYGKESTTYKAPLFFLVGQDITVRGQVAGVNRKITIRVTSLGSAAATHIPVTGVVRAIDGDTDYATTYSGETVAFTADDPGQVTGTAFAEGSGKPEGWIDSLSDREGYTQIFKTACPMFTGSTLATEMRGIRSEFTRVWAEKLMEHKMDIEHAMLFGVGSYASENGTDPKRFTWGILPYTELNGKVYTFSYSNTNYDSFIDTMKDFFAPESGNSRDKLVLASRDILAWFDKIDAGSFLGNTVGKAQYRLDIQNVGGSFGHEVMKVRTRFGNLHFVEEPLLRELYGDYAIAVDLKNVAYRVLAGNGISRDTFIKTNVQDNDADGRIDMITTEAGLEISLPETHAIFKFQ